MSGRRSFPDYAGQAVAMAERCRSVKAFRLACVCDAVAAGVSHLLESEASAAVDGLGELVEWELEGCEGIRRAPELEAAPARSLSDGSRVLEPAGLSGELELVLAGCTGGPAGCLPVLFKGGGGWRSIGWSNSIAAAEALMQAQALASRCVSLATLQTTGRAFYACWGRP